VWLRLSVSVRTGVRGPGRRQEPAAAALRIGLDRTPDPMGSQDRAGALRDVPRLDDLPDPLGRSVLVRTDFNVPLPLKIDTHFTIADDFRIRSALPTLRWLLDRGALVTIASHLGRPGGRPDPRWSMEPVRARVNELLPGVEVLENLRFSPGEEANDPGFGEDLVRGHDLYVNDAFAACHRNHASIVYPPTVLPSAAGRLVEAELDALGRLLGEPERPFVVIVGGAKVTDKLGTVRSLAASADCVLVGGAMAFTFLAAIGVPTGSCFVDDAQLEACRELVATADIELPTDVIGVVAGDRIDPAPGIGRGETRRLVRGIPDGWRGLDIGPDTAERFAERISGARTILWSGPMGVAEDPRFAVGTAAVARAIADSGAFSVVGGGDTVAAIAALGYADCFSHVSTGGGAMLELIEQGDLPGLRALANSRLRP
jgi:phosphoglycerate kinase